MTWKIELPEDMMGLIIDVLNSFDSLILVEN
jgi:hypothetical protein